MSEEMNAEQAADLARLEMMAAEAAPEPGAAPEPEPAVVDPVESLAGLLSIGSMAVGAIGYKRVSALWSATVCHEVAARAVPVMLKYPWGQRAIEFLTTGAGVEEVALAVYLAPIAMSTLAAAKQDDADMARDKKAQSKPEPSTIDAEPVSKESAKSDATDPGPGMQWAA